MTIVRIVRNKGAVAGGGGGPTTLEDDWQLRIGGSGVVAFHDFRSSNEVTAFRWSSGIGGGNDPNGAHALAGNVRRITDDGLASGACLEVLRDADDNEPPVWWRPLAPLTSPGNGKDADDPGANGTISAKSYSPTQGGSQLANFSTGWYGHATYANADPTHFDGNDFYLQIICKMDPARVRMGNEAHTVGKFLWVTTTEGSHSLSGGEHVFWSYGQGGNQGSLRNYLRCYVNSVTGIGESDPLDDEDPSSRIQIGSDSANDFYYSGDWDCILLHIRPGLLGSTSGADCSLLEVWAAHEGETSYTKIWNQEFGIDNYEARNGLQAWISGVYNNGATFDAPFRHRWAQWILSKNTIPCPQVWPTEPAWARTSFAGKWKAISKNVISDIYDPAAGIDGVVGPRCIIDSGNGGCLARSWGRFGALVSHGGGHADYHGNEVYAFDLATGYWCRIIEAFPNPPLTVSNGLFSDGTPNVTHTSQSLVYNPVTNEIAVLHVQTNDSFGHVNRYVTFDRSTNTWRASSVAADFAPVFGAVAYDSDEDRFWVNGGDTGDGLLSYKPGGTHGDTGTWTSHGDPWGQNLNAMGAYDPINKIVVHTTFRQNTNMRGCTVSGGTPGSLSTLTQSGRPSVDEAHGWCYSPKRQAFLYWADGGNVYEVKKGSGTWNVATWTWTLLTDAGNTVSPEGNPQHIYGRFCVATYGSREFAFTWNSTGAGDSNVADGSVYAFEVP